MQTGVITKRQRSRDSQRDSNQSPDELKFTPRVTAKVSASFYGSVWIQTLTLPQV